MATHFYQMESGAQIPLLDRAAIIVAASVWYHEDIIETTRKSISSKKTVVQHDILVKTDNIVKANIHVLPLTACTKQCVQYFSAFVGKGIKNWMQNHHFLTINGTVLSSLLTWNPKGVIDCIETAKKVISHERNILNCFRISCMYCLEISIFKLWDLVKHHYLQYDTYVMECFEVRFWISYIKHDMRVFMNEMQYTGNKDILSFSFNMAVTNNNEIWIEHFMKKTMEDQRFMVAYTKLKYILEMTKTFNYDMIPLLCRYLSHKMFHYLIFHYPGIILQQFLQFPYTDNFIKIANKTWDILPEEDFYKITESIGHYLQEYTGNQIFKNILEDFWRNSPDHCKIYVIRKCIDGSFLNRLGLRKYSSPIIKLIIQSSTTDQKKEMIFSYNGILFFDSLVQKNRWKCFSMSVKEFIGPEDRENWINKLISTFKHIFKTIQFNSFTCNDFNKLIDVLEKQKDKNMYLKE